MSRQRTVFSKKGDSTEVNITDWDSHEQSFLVCVYNVSQDQDYTFLQVPMSSTSQDVVTQVSMASHVVK